MDRRGFLWTALAALGVPLAEPKPQRMSGLPEYVIDWEKSEVTWDWIGPPTGEIVNISDATYGDWFPRGQGTTELTEAAIRRMLDNLKEPSPLPEVFRALP